tara:strand:+ start:467 stop:649 length:183 start_codon:yes stop_codon:yes gene_type:complete
MRGVKIRSLELFLVVKVYHERLYYLAPGDTDFYLVSLMLSNGILINNLGDYKWHDSATGI